VVNRAQIDQARNPKISHGPEEETNLNTGPRDQGPEGAGGKSEVTLNSPSGTLATRKPPNISPRSVRSKTTAVVALVRAHLWTTANPWFGPWVPLLLVGTPEKFGEWLFVWRDPRGHKRGRVLVGVRTGGWARPSRAAVGGGSAGRASQCGGWRASSRSVTAVVWEVAVHAELWIVRVGAFPPLFQPPTGHPGILSLAVTAWRAVRFPQCSRAF
jgi:hypothetical protein